MPSSRYEHISDVMSLLVRLGPSSFLDVGCGFGRWGFLVREWGDVIYERFQKEQWKVRIEAVEVFQPYLAPHQHYIYDQIHVTTIEEYAKTMPRFDVIYMGDVLEHLEKSRGEALLTDLFAKCDQALIIAAPLGDEWPQGAVCGNPYEAHRATWSKKDLRRKGAHMIKSYYIADRRVPGYYAVAAWFRNPRRVTKEGYLRRWCRSSARKVRGLVGNAARLVAGLGSKAGR
jgi:hypothetical protein